LAICRSNGCPRRRGRQTYTRFQTLELEKEFHFNHSLTRRRRIEIAHALCLTRDRVVLNGEPDYVSRVKGFDITQERETDRQKVMQEKRQEKKTCMQITPNSKEK
ncbi:homeobox protein abdominal-A homolog, partial [Penaeus monodon]|uniref:homeobox protein abdominal-A homolog n=1 Tax=Penaeus monodon TaxID=6687 RepID=UPI0018A7AD9E